MADVHPAHEAEAAFRIRKSELSIRPVWHQKAERVQAHILVCFLAYVLWKTLEQWQKRAGLGSSPRTILEELGRIQSLDVVAPLADGSQRELCLFAASSGPTRLRSYYSIGWGSSSRSGSKSHLLFARCRADSQP